MILKIERFPGLSEVQGIQGFKGATNLKIGRRILTLSDNTRYHHAKLHAEWRQDCSGKFSLLFFTSLQSGFESN